MARTRYYIAGQDFTSNPSDYSFVNKDRALIGGRTAGTHEHRGRLPATNLRIGVPPLKEPPKLVVGAAANLLRDVYGFGPRFVSSPARDLLQRLDPLGFEFAECATSDGNGIPIPPYFIMDVIRVTELDEDRSNIQRYQDVYPNVPEAQGNFSILKLNDVYIKSGLSPDAHAFYIPGFAQAFILDEVIVDAWRKEGLIGFSFTPLQPPTQTDLADSNTYLNYPFWKN